MAKLRDRVTESIQKSGFCGLVCLLFVQRYGHHTISGVKCLFHPVSVVHVDVYIKNSLMES